MPKFNEDDYLSVEAYKEALGTLHVISGGLLFEFAREERGVRDIIIRNFIARAYMIARAIFQLWDMKDHQDCFVLYRCLIDRFFHLWYLQQNDEFEVFEEWSFLEQFNALNRVRSNPEYRGALESKSFYLSSEHRKRYRKLAKNPPIWQRPKSEDVAKCLDMRFLYQFGYDFASAHVHPMANDGQQDFYTITKLELAPNFPDHRSVLSNTLLITTMLIQEGLNASNISWRALIFNFLDELRRFLDSGEEDYKVSFLKLGKMIEQGVRMSKS